jgi:hypothetical protein
LNFFTASPPPVAITIDGTAYQIPRLNNATLKAWAAELIERQKNESLARLSSDDDRARFLFFHAEPIFDIASLMQYASTPAGAEYVVDAQLKIGGVPDDTRKALLANANPSQVRMLAQRLTLADEVLRAMGVDTEAEKKDPLPQPAGESAVSPATTPPTQPGSTPATAA